MLQDEIFSAAAMVYYLSKASVMTVMSRMDVLLIQLALFNPLVVFAGTRSEHFDAD